MPTAREVADLAGTSPAVVSYVFNNGPRGVAAATRARVLAAAEELGYDPQGTSRKGAARRVPTVGLVVPSLRSPYYGEIARAIGDAAERVGRVVLLAESRHSADHESRILQSLVERRVDGLIVVALSDDPRLQPAMRYGLPVIELLGMPDHRAAWSSVTIDYAHAAETATRHLLEHGYDTIGLLNLPSSPLARQHRRGFDQATGAHRSRVRTIHWRSELSQQAVTDLAAEVLRSPGRPQAVYCATNVQAAVLLRVAHRLKIRTPGELAVIGYEGPYDPELMSPPLSTVGEPISELGRRAIALVEGRASEGLAAHVVLTGQLFPRRSCGCGLVAAAATPDRRLRRA